MMLPASRIKPRPTPRTPRLALQILPNRHLHPASPAQNRPRIPLLPRPNRNRMPRQLLMTILASPIHPATSHLDRHNIHRRPPMRTPRPRIHFDAAHLRPSLSVNDVLLVVSCVEAKTLSLPECLIGPGNRCCAAFSRTHSSIIIPSQREEPAFVFRRRSLECVGELLFFARARLQPCRNLTSDQTLPQRNSVSNPACAKCRSCVSAARIPRSSMIRKLAQSVRLHSLSATFL
jgi:hypothetical protein